MVDKLPTKEEWIEEYRSTRPLFEQFCFEVKPLLEKLLHSNEIGFHVVEARAKTVESFADKISRPGKGYVRPIEQIKDLSGLRIIPYYLADVQRVCDLIHREFKVDDAKSEDKSKNFEPDRFGYLGVHKIVALSQSRAALTEWASFAGLTAEIQVQTAAQHCWAAISHALQYKQESEVPLGFRRRLARLAGLLELADQEFEALRQQKVALKGVLSEKLSRGELDIAVDVDSIEEFVRRSELVKKLFRSATRAGFMPLPKDNIVGIGKIVGTGISQLTQACFLCGIVNIVALGELLESVFPLAETFFNKFLDTTAGQMVSEGYVAALVVVGSRATHLGKEKVAEALGWSPAPTLFLLI